MKRRHKTQTQWASAQLANQTLDELKRAASEQRQVWLREHGNFSLAYSTAVQPLLQYFQNDEGYIAYRKRWGVTFALGDPLVAESRAGEFLDQFVGSVRNPVFCQISRQTAKKLAAKGFLINEFGVDTRLLLDQFSLNGKEKEWLRYAWNWVHRRGYQVVEAGFDTISERRVEEVSEAWRQTRTVKRKEVRFLNRPILVEDEPDVRRFFLLDPAGEVVAYVFLDPLYYQGKITGYVTAFKRRHPDATQYSEQAIMKAIIERLKEEKVPEIRLGLSPCAWIEDQEFDSSWFTRKLFRTMFDSRLVNSWAYNLVGHGEYKRRFRGQEEKTYFACRSRYSLWELSALVGLCGIA